MRNDVLMRRALKLFADHSRGKDAIRLRHVAVTGLHTEPHRTFDLLLPRLDRPKLTLCFPDPNPLRPQQPYKPALHYGPRG